MSVQDMLAAPTLTKSDMPYVQFKTITVEDPVRTKEDGVLRFKDVDLAVVTVPGDTKSNVMYKVQSFFDSKKQEMANGRIMPEWYRFWESSYKAFQEGKEMPIDGTPILGWKLITGAQQEELIRMNVRTVEELSALSDDGMKHFGMGAAQLKARAKAWLDQFASSEGAAIRISTLEQDNASLQGQLDTMKKQIDDLMSQKEKAKKG